MIRYQEGVFKMLGFSVYLGQNLDRDYILNMADLGYDVVFTSLQIPEEDKKNQMVWETYANYYQPIKSLILSM